MIKRNIIRNLMLLQKAREQAMEKRLQEIMPKVEMDIANTDPKDIPEDFEEMDPKLYGILKKHAYKEPPEHLKEKVLKAVFQKQKSKQKDLKLFILASMQPQLKLQYVAAILILVVVSSTAYYLYGTTNYINPDLTSKKQTPVVNIEPTPTPVPSAEVTPIATPSIVKGNGNDKLNINIENHNNQKDKIAEDQKYQNRANKPKTDTLNRKSRDVQVAENSNSRKNFVTIEDASRGSLRGVIVDFSLLEINQFYVSSFGDSKKDILLKQALVERLKNTDFEILTPAQSLTRNNYGKIIKKGELIQIVLPGNESVLWYKAIKGIAKSPKALANSLVDSLLEDMKNQEKKK